MPPPPPPALPPSPFAARPETYAPHYDRPSPRRSRGYGYGNPAYGFGIDSLAPDAPPPAPDQRSAETPVPPAPKIVEPPVEAPRVAVAHGPDLFYVIPGCYAGNRPPNPERLPKGCDVARMRTTPIR